jgi:RNA-directed DNA polymerase
MDEQGKSDGRVVPAKLTNKAGRPVAETVEERRPAEGNTDSTTRPGRSAGSGVSSGLDRVREVARRDMDVRFAALLAPCRPGPPPSGPPGDPPGGCAGVDGVTWTAYGQDLEANLRDLHARVHSGAYRASPSRRVYIPKVDGRLRPLGIASLEDKILQPAVVGLSRFLLRFRPGRGPHDALDALAVGIYKKKVNWRAPG